MYLVLSLVLLFAALLPGWTAESQGEVNLSLRDCAATNIPVLTKYLQGNALVFDTEAAAPAGAEYFFIRYAFTIPEGGTRWYRLVLTGGRGPGSIGQSRFSWLVDGGAPQLMLRTHQVLPEDGWSEHVQPPIQLAPGAHTLELRFAPDQRLRLMNRATEAFVKHHAEIQRLAWRPTSAPAKIAHPPLSDHCRLRGHDVVVLYGDSITEENGYARHFTRIINQAFPGSDITVYNAGISLNRTLEGVERLDKDVLPLAPDWAVLTFGVNDAMQLSPEDFLRLNEEMIQRLQAHGVRVVCASPSGMTPYVEALGEPFFSMHATDRATGIDRTMALNAQGMRILAHKYQAPFADVYGAFTSTSIPRFTLMGNQWHPNEEGGRMYAVALLRALGMTETEIARTGDDRDLACYRAQQAMPPAPALTRVEPKTPSAPLKGTVLCAAAYGDNRVLVCRPDGQVLAVLPTAHHPAALAYARGRKELYVACEGAGRIQIISLPLLRPAGEIDLGLEAYPISLALSPDESTLWVGSFFGSKVIELDLATRHPRRELHVSDIVNGIALAPDNNTLLVSLPGKLAFLDLKRGEVTATAETVKFTAACVPAADGTPVLLDAAHWQCWPVDMAAHKLGKPQPAPAQTRAQVIDPASGHRYAGDWLNARLLEFNGSRLLHVTPLPVPVMALCVVNLPE